MTRTHHTVLIHSCPSCGVAHKILIHSPTWCDDDMHRITIIITPCIMRRLTSCARTKQCIARFQKTMPETFTFNNRQLKDWFEFYKLTITMLIHNLANPPPHPTLINDWLLMPDTCTPTHPSNTHSNTHYTCGTLVPTLIIHVGRMYQNSSYMWNTLAIYFVHVGPIPTLTVHMGHTCQLSLHVRAHLYQHWLFIWDMYQHSPYMQGTRYQHSG